MRIPYPSALALALLLPAANAALAGASVTATATSDYLYNGISQTGEKPAFQVGVDYEADGFYLGAWTSDVDVPLPGDDARREVDYYGGYRAAAGEQLAWDVGVSHYSYPRAEDSAELDYTEVYAGVTLWSHTGIKLWYSDDFSGDSGNAWFGRLSHTREWGGTAFTAEYNRVEHLDQPNYWNGRDGYNHWRIGAACDVAGFTVDLSYHNTDLEGGPEYSRDDGDERLVLSVSRSFELQPE